MTAVVYNCLNILAKSNNKTFKSGWAVKKKCSWIAETGSNVWVILQIWSVNESKRKQRFIGELETARDVSLIRQQTVKVRKLL